MTAFVMSVSLSSRFASQLHHHRRLFVFKPCFAGGNPAPRFGVFLCLAIPIGVGARRAIAHRKSAGKEKSDSPTWGRNGQYGFCTDLPTETVDRFSGVALNDDHGKINEAWSCRMHGKKGRPTDTKRTKKRTIAISLLLLSAGGGTAHAKETVIADIAHSLTSRAQSPCRRLKWRWASRRRPARRIRCQDDRYRQAKRSS